MVRAFLVPLGTLRYFRFERRLEANRRTDKKRKGPFRSLRVSIDNCNSIRRFQAKGIGRDLDDHFGKAF